MPHDLRPASAAGPTRWFGPALFAGFTILYAWTSGAFVHWLDSGELALAGASLGVPHPPGHPGYVVAAHGLTGIPIGSVAFRTALFSGFAAALAVVSVYAMGLWSTAQVSQRRPTTADAITAALMASAFGLSAGLWINAIRAEVYALQVCAAMWSLYLAMRWRAAPDRPEFIRWAALLAGIALTNHHYLMILVLPALLTAVLLGAEHRASARRQVAWVIGLGALPLLAYAALFISAGNTPWLNFGDPSTGGRLWDVVTAKQFQQAVAHGGSSIGENVFVAVEMLIDQVRLPVVGLAAIGWFALLKKARPLGILVTVATLGNLASKVVMDLDPQNPDAAGYLLLTSALVCVVAAVGATWTWEALGPIGGRIATALAVTATALSVGLAAPETLGRTDGGHAMGTAALDAASTKRMLPHGVALTAFYTFHFNRMYYAGVEGYRSDVVALQQGLEGQVDGGRSLLRWATVHAPRLVDTLKAYVERGDGVSPPPWPAPQLASLAATMPLYLEPSLDSPVHASFTNYASIYQRWRHAGLPASRSSSILVDDLASLGVVMGSELRGSREARKAVTLMLLQLAIDRLKQVDGVGALATLSMIDIISPHNPYTSRLRPVAEPLERAARSGDMRQLRALSNQAMRADYGAILFGGSR